MMAALESRIVLVQGQWLRTMMVMRSVLLLLLVAATGYVVGVVVKSVGGSDRKEREGWRVGRWCLSALTD